jgi:hypothetical protein
MLLAMTACGRIGYSLQDSAPPLADADVDRTTAVDAQSANLIVNGDFEAGNVSFGSDYVPGGSDLGLEGSYKVLTSPVGEHPSAGDLPDHTSGAGYMLLANGALSPLRLWYQQLPIAAGRQYEFRGWMTRWLDGVASVRVAMDGQELIAVDLGNGQHPVGEWQEVVGTWNAPAQATSAVLSISNITVESGGNDFAVDDLAFRALP